MEMQVWRAGISGVAEKHQHLSARQEIILPHLNAPLLKVRVKCKLPVPEREYDAVAVYLIKSDRADVGGEDKRGLVRKFIDYSCYGQYVLLVSEPVQRLTPGFVGTWFSQHRKPEKDPPGSCGGSFSFPQ